jgi:hypothetical protein
MQKMRAANAVMLARMVLDAGDGPPPNTAV